MQPLAEIPFVAGHPALDFVNTAEERGHPDAGDALATARDLRYWGNRYGLVTRSATSSTDADTEFPQAIEARELLYLLFHAQACGRPLPRASLDRLAELVADAYRAGRLEADGDGVVSWSWDRSELASIRHVAVTSGLELLRADRASRLKQCPGDHCGWFFLDATKRGNRRWCSMSECGQDAKNRKRRTVPS